MVKNKTDKKKSQWSTTFLIIGCSAIVGLVIGFISGAFFDTYNIEIDLTLSIIGFIAFFMSLFIHILFHEAGHLVFGLLTGYTYVSFRVGSLTFIKEDGRFKRKRMNLPGTGGQCLMSPPAYKNGDFPFVLYNLGGVLVNLILSIVAFVFVINGLFLFSISTVIWSAFSLAGLFSAIINGVPMKIGGLPNDGYNLYLLLKEKENKRAFFTQLTINALMTKGKRVKDVSLETLQLEGEKEYTNPLKASIYLLEYNWYLDQLKFDEARTCIDPFKPYLEELPEMYKNELYCEWLFLELIQQEELHPFVVKNLYTDALQKYIKMTTYLPNKKRLMMAYEAFYQKDQRKATDYYTELLKTAEMYPVKGEADMEVMLGEWISEQVSPLRVVNEENTSIQA